MKEPDVSIGNERESLAVVAATEFELLPFLDGLRPHTPKRGLDGRIRFYTGEHVGLPLIAVHTGIGKVNTALALQVLADFYPVAGVIQVGLAGAVAERLDVGDIVIGSEFIQHDVDLTLFGLLPGEIALGGAIRDGNLFIGEELRVQRCAADDRLVALTESVATRTDFARGVPRGATRGVQIVTGTIVSGDQFIFSVEKTRWLRDTFGALATEMEGAAAAYVCRMNGVPFVGIRAISDKANHTAHVDFPSYISVATRTYYQIASEVIRRWNGS